MQENDNELNIFTKLKKQINNKNVKIVSCKVSLAFFRSHVKKIFKFTFEIAQEKVGRFKILKATVYR